MRKKYLIRKYDNNNKIFFNVKKFVFFTKLKL